MLREVKVVERVTVPAAGSFSWSLTPGFPESWLQKTKTNAWQVLSSIELDLVVWLNGGGLQLTYKAELIRKPPGGERHLLQVSPVQELDVGTGHTALVIILCQERPSS